MVPAPVLLAGGIYAHGGELAKNVISLLVVGGTPLGESVATQLLGDEAVPREYVGDLLVGDPAPRERGDPGHASLRSNRRAVEQLPEGALGDVPHAARHGQHVRARDGPAERIGRLVLQISGETTVEEPGAHAVRDRVRGDVQPDDLGRRPRLALTVKRGVGFDQLLAGEGGDLRGAVPCVKFVESRLVLEKGGVDAVRAAQVHDTEPATAFVFAPNPVAERPGQRAKDAVAVPGHAVIECAQSLEVLPGIFEVVELVEVRLARFPVRSVAVLNA